mmetsp:Transcript_51796/g.92357  ORF Transcript_51796/g.92357 Transcript_51796/m.92357 type:complete len:224 (-) Transcript_51796:688-1359(-)
MPPPPFASSACNLATWARRLLISIVLPVSIFPRAPGGVGMFPVPFSASSFVSFVISASFSAICRLRVSASSVLPLPPFPVGRASSCLMSAVFSCWAAVQAASLSFSCCFKVPASSSAAFKAVSFSTSWQLRASTSSAATRHAASFSAKSDRRLSSSLSTAVVPSCSVRDATWAMAACNDLSFSDSCKVKASTSSAAANAAASCSSNSDLSFSNFASTSSLVVT